MARPVLLGRRLLRGRTCLFLGAFTRFNHLEPSSFIGLGDNHAVHELATKLGRFGASFDIAYTSRMTEGQQRENMILVGLDEVNSLTPSVLEKVGSGFRANVESMTIEDVRTGRRYSSDWDLDLLEGTPVRDFDEGWFISVGVNGGRTARRFRADYGVLVRGQNPFAPRRTLLVIAGIYGFGTWAGAQLPFDEEFLRRCAGYRNFECLYRVEVHKGQLLDTSIVMLRSLPELPVGVGRPVLSRFRHPGARSGLPPPYGPGGIPRGATVDDPPGG